MKVEELMIGDWVHKKIYLIGRDIPPYEEDVQIFNIYGYLLNCKIRDNTIISGSYLDGFEPIPLTEEILKANGFNKGSYVGGFLINGFPFRVLVSESTTKFVQEECPINETIFYCTYVHELQHALRICGLNELADNFVIR